MKDNKNKNEVLLIRYLHNIDMVIKSFFTIHTK